MKMLLYSLTFGSILASLSGTNQNIKKRIGFWGTWHIPCGIAMYTKHVSDSLQKLGYKTVHYNYFLPLDSVVSRVLRNKINILNIQYEQGIMPSIQEFLDMIHKLKSQGVKILITMHDEPPWSQILVDAADRVIYHKKPQYLNNDSKVEIIPMGVPVFNPDKDRLALREAYGFKETDKILVSTGFMLPTKEIGSILEHLAPALRKNTSVKVQLLHAFTPRNPPACKETYEKVIEVIDKFRLHDQVVLITRFISQKELNERLHLSDLGYQWFCSDTSATSATAKEYISARTPLIVPDSSHFHDLKSPGIIMTPRDKQVFADTVMRYLFFPYKLSFMKDKLYTLYESLNYDIVIREKYHALFESM